MPEGDLNCFLRAALNHLPRPQEDRAGGVTLLLTVLHRDFSTPPHY